MKLYHGSKNGNLTTIKKMQAQAGDGVDVPEDELKDGIYLTPYYEFALACAVRPNGVTHIKDEEKTIEFENPEGFFPEKDVYVYEVEVPEGVARQFDKNQLVIENMDEIAPTAKHQHKAGDIEQYYELINWKKEAKNETAAEFKIK